MALRKGPLVLAATLLALSAVSAVAMDNENSIAFYIDFGSDVEGDVDSRAPAVRSSQSLSDTTSRSFSPSMRRMPLMSGHGTGGGMGSLT
jgi:hypothetical protein